MSHRAAFVKCLHVEVTIELSIGPGKTRPVRGGGMTGPFLLTASTFSARLEAMSKTQKKAYKYRFYPTPEQAVMLARTFGCCRVVYNWGLRERSDAYSQRGERLSYDDLSARLTTLKKQEAYTWLTEVSSVPLQQTLRHLDRAFLNFFEGRAKYPTVKKSTAHKRRPLRAVRSGGMARTS